MSAIENSVVKQLRTIIEEDRQVIRTLRQEIDRLRFLLGLHSLKNREVNAAPGAPPSSRPTQFHHDFSG